MSAQIEQKNNQTNLNEREIKPYNPENFFRIDGLTFETVEGEKRVVIPTTVDEKVQEQRKKLKNTYNVQGDFIYITGESGEITIVPNTQAELKKIIEAGYTYFKEATHYIEDAQPTNLKSRIEFLEFRLKTIEQRKKENIELHLSIYQERAEQLELREIINGYFIKIDGVEYNNFINGGRTERIPVNTDGNDFRLDRLKAIGIFTSNNGKLCFVGPDGSMYLGANTSENIKALTKAGYREGNLFVPFSNGETPINDEMKQLLNDVCSGKKPEELRAERLARVVNFAGTNRRLFGTLPKTQNDELMKIFSDVVLEHNFQTSNKEERQRIIEAARTETDQYGRSLKIYQINGREIVFRGREELPEIETLNSGNTILVGGSSINIPERFSKPYENKITGNQVQGQETILAVKNLRGVLEAAVILGLKDEKILQLLEEIKQGHYSDRAIEMVDALVALNYYRSEQGDLFGEMETDSEIIFIHALLGNDEAQKYVTSRLIEYHSYSEHTEEQRKDKYREDYGKFKGEALRTQELCIVHSTKYEPRRDEEGIYSIPTIFDATNGEYLRNSIHLTLNHKVHSHWDGNWESNGFIIIAPFSDTLAANGNPEAVNFNDTWWMMNPGQRFIFRDATVISFSNDTNGELAQFDDENGTIRLKPIGYTASDLRALRGMETLSYDRTTEIFTDIINGYVSKLEYERSKKLRDEGSTVTNHTPMFDFNTSDYEAQRKLTESVSRSIENSEGKTMEEIAEGIIMDIRLHERVRDEVRREASFDLEDTMISLIEYMAKEGEIRVSALLTRIATEQALERRGFQVARTTRENNGYGLGSGFNGDEMATGAQYGSKVGLHDGTPEHRMTHGSLFDITRTFKESWHDSDEAILSELRPMTKSTYIDLREGDPSIRRMLYVSGITPSYTGKDFRISY